MQQNICRFEINLTGFFVYWVNSMLNTYTNLPSIIEGFALFGSNELSQLIDRHEGKDVNYGLTFILFDEGGASE